MFMINNIRDRTNKKEFLYINICKTYIEHSGFLKFDKGAKHCVYSISVKK